MTAMYWQTALLLGLAYFAGCCLACMLRRMLSDAPDVRATVPDVAMAPVARQAAQKPLMPGGDVPLHMGLRLQQSRNGHNETNRLHIAEPFEVREMFGVF